VARYAHILAETSARTARRANVRRESGLSIPEGTMPRTA